MGIYQRRIVVLVVCHATTTKFGNRIINYIFSPNPRRLKIETSWVALHWPWALGNLGQDLLYHICVVTVVEPDQYHTTPVIKHLYTVYTWADYRVHGVLPCLQMWLRQGRTCCGIWLVAELVSPTKYFLLVYVCYIQSLGSDGTT